MIDRQILQADRHDNLIPFLGDLIIEQNIVAHTSILGKLEVERKKKMLDYNLGIIRQ